MKTKLIKKISAVILASVMAQAAHGASVFGASCGCPKKNAADEIGLVINGVKQELEQAPADKDGNILIPLRDICERLGISVTWNEETETVTCVKGKNRAELSIGSASAEVNGGTVSLDSMTELINDRTYASAQLIEKAFENEVSYSNETKTLTISDGMAKSCPFADTDAANAVNTVRNENTVNTTEAAIGKPAERRDIPGKDEFIRSSELNNLIFAPDYKKGEQNVTELPSGKVVYSLENYLNDKTAAWSTSEMGKTSAVDVTGQPFKKALRITTTKAPGKTVFGVYPGPNAMQTTVSEADRFYMTFSIRTVSGGDTNGNGRITPFVQTKDWVKSIETEVFAGSDWETYYLAFGGVANSKEIGFFISNFVQTVEIGGFKIVKLDDPSQVDAVMKLNPVVKSLTEGAEWRAAALNRIKEIRKGDFFVAVKDKDGNPIKNAEVTFNMTEHEFLFGSMGAQPMTVYANEEWAKLYSPTLGRYFNTMVVGNEMKWYQYLRDPAEARNQIEVAKRYGVKNFRGHTLFWPISSNRSETDENLIVIPPVLFEYLDNNDRESFDNAVKEHIFSECAAFPDVCRWDVVNEISSRTEFEDKFGADIYKKMFEWTRQATPEGTKLVWNDYPNPLWKTNMLEKIKKFKDIGVDYDVIGIQCHEDSLATLKTPAQWLELFDELAAESGKELELTEFSVNGTDEELQAAYLRDMMIAVFSHEAFKGFTMWGHTDIWASQSTPLFKNNWHKKAGLAQYVDLVYNKWWTRDETAKTNCSGRCKVNGFYGDYDITVSYEGKTKTVSVPFYKNNGREAVVTLD